MSGSNPATAETIRSEVQQLLRTIAGAGKAGVGVKAAINRTVEHLAHPELGPGVVKRFWYGEQAMMPAHLVDHIRCRASKRYTAGFAFERQGRIVPLGAAAQPPAVAVRLGDERVTIEISAKSVSHDGMAMLRQWLLAMLNDGRDFRLVDLDHGGILEVRGAMDVLERLDGMTADLSAQASQMTGTTPMMADAEGIAPLRAPMRDHPGAEPEHVQMLAASLVRGSDRIAFLPEPDRLTVLARAHVPWKVVQCAAAWLAAQGRRSVRLRVWVGHGWINELFDSGPLASTRLCELTGMEALASAPPAYRGRRIRTEEMSESEIRLFAPILALSGKALHDGVFNALQRRGMGDRLSITAPRDGHAHIVYCPPGPDYVGRTWWIRAPGLRIVDIPDHDYGAQVNARMIAAAEEGGLHIERVQACIRESGDDLRLRDVRLSAYTRVAVPCRCGNERIVVSYTVLHRWGAAPLAMA